MVMQEVRDEYIATTHAANDIYVLNYVLDGLFADDIFAIVQYPQIFSNILSQKLASVGLSLSPSKCQILHFNSTQPPVTVDGATIPVVTNITILGVIISPDAPTAEIDNRKSRANAIIADIGKTALFNCKLNLQLRSRIYQATARYCLTYGIASLALRADELKSLLVFDRRIIRLMCRGWRPKTITTDGIPETIWVPLSNEIIHRKCRTTPLEKQIKSCRWTWAAHLARRPQFHPFSQLIENIIRSQPTTKRAKGGQRLTWIRLLLKEAPEYPGLNSLWNALRGPRDQVNAFIKRR